MKNIFTLIPILAIVSAGQSVRAETTITIEKKKSDAFYSPFGKRDPFRIPTVGGLGEDSSVGPLQRFHVDQFRLRAIMRGMGEPRAMFEDPKGRSHIVNQGDLIGIERATVSRIIKSEVILTERTYNYLGKESLLERVIALPQETELDPLQLMGKTEGTVAPEAPVRPNPMDFEDSKDTGNKPSSASSNDLSRGTASSPGAAAAGTINPSLSPPTGITPSPVISAPQGNTSVLSPPVGNSGSPVSTPTPDTPAVPVPLPQAIQNLQPPTPNTTSAQ